MNNFPRYLGTHIKAHTIVVNSAREKKRFLLVFNTRIHKLRDRWNNCMRTSKIAQSLSLKQNS